MPEEITCCCCKQKIKANPRLKGSQRYCGKPECRKARRRLWQYERMHKDGSYNSKQRGLVKRWRKGKPADKYMSEYRQNHPGYVADNRQKQTRRNLTRREREKMLMGEKIVKMDSLIVQLKQIKALSLQIFWVLEKMCILPFFIISYFNV